MADKMTGFKNLIRELASLFSNIKYDIDSFKFLYTKYLNRDDEGKAFDKESVKKIK
jgi:hypothetical protein